MDVSPRTAARSRLNDDSAEQLWVLSDRSCWGPAWGALLDPGQQDRGCLLARLRGLGTPSRSASIRGLQVLSRNTQLPSLTPSTCCHVEVLPASPPRHTHTLGLLPLRHQGTRGLADHERASRAPRHTCWSHPVPSPLTGVDPRPTLTWREVKMESQPQGGHTPGSGKRSLLVAGWLCVVCWVSLHVLPDSWRDSECQCAKLSLGAATWPHT